MREGVQSTRLLLWGGLTTVIFVSICQWDAETASSNWRLGFVPVLTSGRDKLQRGEASVVVTPPAHPDTEPGNVVITADDAQAAYDGTSEAALAQVHPLYLAPKCNVSRSYLLQLTWPQRSHWWYLQRFRLSLQRINRRQRVSDLSS